MFSVISHTKSLYKSYYKAPFLSSLLELNPLIRKIYQNLSKVCIRKHFLKFAHFDKIKIFQFLTNFTKIAEVSYIVQLHFYNAPL